jgi:hypothetical protein
MGKNYAIQTLILVLILDFLSKITFAQKLIKDWDATIGATGTDSLRAVIESTDGSFILLGKNDYFKFQLLRINDKGKALWNRDLTEACTLAIVINTKDNGYGGTTSAGVDYYGDVVKYYLITKTDANGNVL